MGLGGGQAGGPRLGCGTEGWPGRWPDELLPSLVVVRYCLCLVCSLADGGVGLDWWRPSLIMDGGLDVRLLERRGRMACATLTPLVS